MLVHIQIAMLAAGLMLHQAMLTFKVGLATAHTTMCNGRHGDVLSKMVLHRCEILGNDLATIFLSFFSHAARLTF